MESLVHDFLIWFLVLAFIGAVLVAYGTYMAARHGVPWVVDKLKGMKAAATTDYAELVAAYQKVHDLVKTDLVGLESRLTAAETGLKGLQTLLNSVMPPKAGA